MAKKSSFLNMAISLGAICFVCSALLGAVYIVTADPIEQAKVEKENAAIALVVPEYDNNPYNDRFEVDGYTVYPAIKDGRIVGHAVKSNATGFGGTFYLMVGFANGGTIYNTSVLEHSETPGLGAKMANNDPGNFREQFNGHYLVDDSGRFNVKLKKDGGEFDAITASTISSRAFISALEKAAEIYAKVPMPLTDGLVEGNKIEEDAQNE